MQIRVDFQDLSFDWDVYCGDNHQEVKPFLIWELGKLVATELNAILNFMKSAPSRNCFGNSEGILRLVDQLLLSIVPAFPIPS